MFSVMYTGMNFFPLCTASVWPTISGVTADRRDQVLMTFRSKRRFMSSIFFIRWPSTKGPFLIERLIGSSLLVPVAHDELVRAGVVARLVALGRGPPRGHRVASAGGLALSPAVRMVHG